MLIAVFVHCSYSNADCRNGFSDRLIWQSSISGEVLEVVKCVRLGLHIA